MNYKKRYKLCGWLCIFGGVIFFARVYLSVYLNDLGSAILALIPTLLAFQAAMIYFFLSKLDQIKRLLE